ncbi:MAG: UDP-N-acetylmuramoyl-tripeptide--D-alanyl-D-alanine ligase [Vicinamibacterales bacterium]|nr:UDP-N-acetylmuramoyl-tripeptide--D-alanyl-D-alanine ligase [Vicinamibacterales bacterium]
MSAAAAVLLTAAQAASAMAGSLTAGPGSAAIRGFSIDTRTLRAGDVYIAIIGERLDGHRFVREALQAGAAGLVVSDLSPVSWPLDPAVVVVRVDDTTAALQRLAKHVRRASGAQVVAITGSAGKTTTKEITAELLGARYRVFRNHGNFNNHIGLPLSLLELRHGPEIAVVELGMNHAGEIRLLVGLAEPDVRVWTMVAEVHSAFFASLDAIADAKAEILEGATAGSIVVANAADPLVMARVKPSPARVITFGIGVPADVSATGVVDRGLAGTRATVTTASGTAAVDVPLLGRGHLGNALAAMAVAGAYGVPLDVMVERLAATRPAARRGEVWRLPSGVTLVDDSYNSNPRALERTLEAVAAEGGCARRLAVLGEMLELGEQAGALHEACGRAAARAGLAHLVTVGGPPALALANAAVAAGMPPSAVRHVGTSADAADFVVPLLREGDVVLVKGSRGIRTDIVADAVKAAGA